MNTSVIKAAKMRVLEPVLACSQTANRAAMAYEKAMEGHRDTDADDIRLSCLSTEVRSAASQGFNPPRLTGNEQAKTSSVTKQ